MGTVIAQNKFLVVIAGLAIAFGLWYGLSPREGGTLLVESQGGAGQEVVDTLRQLDAVKLDGTLLSNQAFASLQDFSTQIIPEPVGRPNPFAPLSVSPSLSASSTKDAAIFSPGGRR